MLSVLIALALQISLALAGPLGLPDQETIVYLTDVEGNWSQVETFLKDNPFVYRDQNGITRLRDGATFVFGGDTVDKGGDDLKITRWLMDLKKRYPDRVILLAGNRDSLKITLPRLTAPEYIDSQPALKASWEQWLKQTKPSMDIRETQAERLKWALSSRLGAPRSFELRRAELARERALASSAVTDSDVARSFFDELGTNGSLRFYLENSQLAYVRGNTLFVHGAITEENMGLLPLEFQNSEPARTGSIKEWVNALNKWHREQITDWSRTKSYPRSFIEYHHKRPQSDGNAASIVYGRYSDHSGNPELPSREVIEWLKARGIRRIVVGHTPSGEVPALLRENGFEIIIADTSGSTHGSQLFISPRRCVLRSETTVQTEAGPRKVPIESRWRINDDTWLGRRIPGSSVLVKAKTPQGDWLISEVIPPDYRVQETLLREDELRERIQNGKRAVCPGYFKTITVR